MMFRDSAVRDAAVVQYKGTFFILGGGGFQQGTLPPRRLDTVLRYNENGEWETLPVRLAVGRAYHIAIPKPTC